MQRNDLYYSPNIIRVIKSGRMTWKEHVSHIGERCVQGFGGALRERGHFGKLRRRWGRNIKWKSGSRMLGDSIY